MTKAESRKIEIRLRARGKETVCESVSDGVLAVESYPLTVHVQAGPCDPEMGSGNVPGTERLHLAADWPGCDHHNATDLHRAGC